MTLPRAITLLLLFLSLYSLGQKIEWNRFPKKGIVYKISNKEAKKYLTKYLSNAKIEKLLHTQVDTFHLDSGWVQRPEYGHFILLNAVENRLKCTYTSVRPYQVFLMKEYEALSIQVVDAEGKVRKDAKVKRNGLRLNYDPEVKSYRTGHKYVNRAENFLTIELDGHLSIFELTKYDAPREYGGYNSFHDRPDFYSYLITDKNRYRPGDTVRYKSYALGRSRFPLKRELKVILYKIGDWRSQKNIGTITPHRPGSYTGDFVISDSLDLKLDTNYSLKLVDKSGRIVSNTQFKYEDYELFGNRLSVKLDHSIQHFPNDNVATINATDVNGNLLKDAKAMILVRPLSILNTYQDVSIIPDTLMYKEMKLNPTQSTSIPISSEILGSNNLIYEVQVAVLNSENERNEQSSRVSYFYDSYELKSKFEKDTIVFELFRNGQEMENVPMQMIRDGKSQVVTMPHIEPVDPFVENYNFSNDEFDQNVIMSQLKTDLEIKGILEMDSLIVNVSNPQNLEFSWYIYQGANLIARGRDKELDYSHFITDRTMSYYVELIYPLGGELHLLKKTIEFTEQYLDVDIAIPDRVFPGQKLEAIITVKDSRGLPKKNVNLTALAVNDKLDYYIPNLPYYGDKSRARAKPVTYQNKELDKRTRFINLDFDQWQKILGLDTMTYYQFTYPKSSPFRYELLIDGETQMMVYLMEEGRAIKPQVIEVNNKPVYFSWSDRAQHSFLVPNDTFELMIRTHDRVFLIDSVSVKAGHKTILSYDTKTVADYGGIYPVESKLSNVEQNRYRPLTSVFHLGRYNYSYLMSPKQFSPLSGRDRRRNLRLGPIQQGRKLFRTNLGDSLNFKYQGGYRYSFEDNVVYKGDEDYLLPNVLNQGPFIPVEKLNDLVWTEKSFIRHQKVIRPKKPWKPGRIDILGGNSKITMDFGLMDEGVSSIFFINKKDNSVILPCLGKKKSHGKIDLENGLHEIVILYNDDSFHHFDSVDVQEHTLLYLNFSNSNPSPSDSLSEKWLYKYGFLYDNCFGNFDDIENQLSSNKYTMHRPVNQAGNVQGMVVDETGMGLPGATILIKGTNRGTITDMEGRFSLFLDDYNGTLVVSFIGYATQEIEATRGSEIYTSLDLDAEHLTEVIVTGYSVSYGRELTGAIRGISIHNDPQVSIDSDLDVEEKKSAEDRLYQEIRALSDIRSNFNDVAFWQPKLYTDKKGTAKFDIKFPDNITKWSTTVLAMNRFLETGTARKKTRSYKPITTELKVPRFLTLGDTCKFIGKTSNYTSDTLINGEVEWKMSDVPTSKEVSFSQTAIDELIFTAQNLDTVSVTHSFKRSDGYGDGEKRKIPVILPGTIKAEGSLQILPDGEIFKTIVDKKEEVRYVSILQNQLDFYRKQSNYLINYKYDCNEQLASKLIGLLSQQLLCAFDDKRFEKAPSVKKIIRRLLKNQNDEFYWSWWNRSNNTSYWVSGHVLRALFYAKELGYNVPIDKDNLARKVRYKYEFLKSFTLSDAELINAMSLWGVSINYSKYTQTLDTLINYYDSLGLNSLRPTSYLYERLLSLEAKQLSGMEHSMDSLLKYQKTDLLNRVYFDDGKRQRKWLQSDQMLNSMAYRIVRRDSTLHNLLPAMQLFILDTHSGGAWNTLEASNSLMTILPDLIAQGNNTNAKGSVFVNGQRVTNFDKRLIFSYLDSIRVLNQSGFPILVQNYVEKRYTEKNIGIEGLDITTYFDKNYQKELHAGRPVTLKTKVDINKKTGSENLMIEIPIPASCSYASKEMGDDRYETHREYFKQKVVVFCEKLQKGSYVFDVKLLPRFKGSFQINPAHVSLMYVPVVNANNDLKSIKVQ